MTTQTEQSYVSVEDRRARGEEAAKQVPVSAHATWRPATDRVDPVELLVAQNVTREADLVPVRHGRMMVSPFTFYRGAAKGDGRRPRRHTDGRAERAAVR